MQTCSNRRGAETQGKTSKCFLLAAIYCLLFLVYCLLPTKDCHARVVKDNLGRAVNISDAPPRIVSLSPGITETLFALGLDEEIVGVTTFCDFPEKAKGKEKIGGFTNPNIEKIISLRPTLVIATTEGNSRDAVEKLREFEIPVFIIKTIGFEGVLNSIASTGSSTGREAEASRIVSGMKERIEGIKKRVKGLWMPKVFYQLWHDPLTAAGKGTFIDDMIGMAGGENIVKQQGYPVYSKEKVVVSRPDVIIVSSMAQQPDITIWKGWDIPALKNKMLFPINPDIVHRPGPRLIEGFERIAEMLHPEVFVDKRNADKK